MYEIFDEGFKNNKEKQLKELKKMKSTKILKKNILIWKWMIMN